LRSKALPILVCSLSLLFAFPLLAATVAINPTSVTLATTAARQFTATVSGAADTTVTWSVNDIAGGNTALGRIDTTGRYVAPSAPPPGYAVTVRATSNADPAASQSSAVTIRWQSPSVTTVSPNPIAPGAFSITVTGARFVNGAVVQWNGASLPTAFVSATSLTATGTATQLGTNTVRVANPGPSSVSPNVNANVVTNLVVSVTPPSPAVPIGQTLQLTASVANTANQAVNWSASAGTIDASGLYTAPQSMPFSGYATITAVSAADNVTFGKTTVTFTDPQAVTYSRFLEQATFGPSPQSLARVRQIGIPAYVDEQLAKPESPLPPLATATRNGILNAFFGNALGGDDQLRQRVLFALSEVIVISRNKNVNTNDLLPWLVILSRNAFGNYRTLLGEITLDASMGHYLDMVNSAKPGLAEGANENYPREVMQLFSLGIYELHPDGSVKLDPDGQPIPAYTQTDVQQLALAFTGWTYNNASNTPTAAGLRGSYYPGPMVPAPAYHDTRAKTVLGHFIPAGQTPLQDVNAGLDILFQHPNVGPFVATRLIRALVTSNPSPQYIQRVAAKFDDNGQGVRGDLPAVVRAILLDPEARNDDPPSDFGRLRTPVQHTIAMSRALSLPLTSASNFDYLLGDMGESLLNAPSVFGHYSPTFRLPGTALYAPEFQIYSPTEAVNRANFLHSFWSGSGGALPAALQPFAAIASDATALTNAVDHTLLYGRMPAATRAAILQALPLMYDNPQRVRTALYLTLMSGDYLVQH
jgi:uncharacterized protein (DUF1800 family)